MDSDQPTKPDEWCRRRSWTDEDQKAFFDRLKKCRSDSTRTQAFRSQASCLLENGYAREAIELLNQLLGEHPQDYFRGLTYTSRADAHLSLGKPDAAIADYRTALDIEKDACPNVHTNAWHDLPWLIVEVGREDLYQEAIEALKFGERQQSLTFPMAGYIINGVQAVIAEHRGAAEDAIKYARNALESSSQGDSGLRYHPRVGLVSKRFTESKTHARLLQLIKGR